MLNRQTIENPVEVEGIALHSGGRVRLRLVPAGPGTGVVFVRTDRGDAEIPAKLEFQAPSFYSTVLRNGEESVGTVEHLMAAVSALLVDDLRIELDGPEVPILDGSARPFVELIRSAGFREHAATRDYLTLTRPIVLHEEEKRIAAYPGREFRVTYAIDFDHPLLGHQELSVSLWDTHAFAEKLAPARTFTFERDVEALRGRGLALGGSLDNAIVLGEDGILNEQELRYPDEFVRHKILDLTGDLSLVGRAVRAHVVAYRAGHDLHLRLARAILQARDSWYLAPWSEEAPRRGATAQA
ncbi:MAG: UDP-3-O-[3-hydroxymyristoyl] N-acetylglucosamine deacetylase [Acidobacteria bacterium]|nr:UDP-3-O-[3-hydroxymyristoyl] N-acetylglucosamine deacetylase [Acidobacteriota bacterium]NIM64230.1 UDP-3-O-[3-hydroxymyristoyl] N-acetylglucosamine deacetylase [Acidobacteriota bacterium]NIO59228.1 UDP-3-O-[3-hydroxymyristoyl] N-acetylglucosamine deacetylase [Acidobacteriota bacterium]NIQ30255.1 UDP-3-O-[3-hydroxymyristoyl] N-acetylglucosamine deacetylase [Acidobacteriota bacterium]NIQ85183.1 UDP-3-O-[3-hydroxymyristoyl] N-acetylglucosamine deacetylase [Acidobacteriota bacterium]